MMTKWKIYALMLCTVAVGSGACSTDNEWMEEPEPPVVPDNGRPEEGGSADNGGPAGDATASGVADFDIAFDRTPLEEPETVPAGDEDYWENVAFDGTVTITFADASATVSGDSDGAVTVSGSRVTVKDTKGSKYILKGTTANGSLTLTAGKSVAIVLDGVSLANPTGAAINIQSKVCAYVVANDGTENTLADGSRTEDDTKVKGTFYTKGKAVFSGKGKLNVYAKYKNGIDTKLDLVIRPNTDIFVQLADTISKGCCLKCENDADDGGMLVKGGVLNLDNPTVAGKGLSADGNLTIGGGRIVAICTGDGLWELEELDISGAAGIKCDGTFTLNAGDLRMKSTGAGGKGINGDATLNFCGGTVHVLTTGGVSTYRYNNYTYDTSPKGIKCDGDIFVTGGEIYVRATGAKEGSEGIEAKQAYNQSGGSVSIYAADDALNAGYSADGLREKIAMGYDMTGCVADAGQVNISGGSIYAYSLYCDGIDSNGYISVSGGTVASFGANAMELSFDCDQNSRFSVTGGTLFGMSGGAPNTPAAACTQCFVVVSFTANANTSYTVKSADGQEIVTATVPRAYSNGALVVSSPLMQKSSSYTIGLASFSTGTSWITSNVQGGGGAGGPGGGRP